MLNYLKDFYFSLNPNNYVNPKIEFIFKDSEITTFWRSLELSINDENKYLACEKDMKAYYASLKEIAENSYPLFFDYRNHLEEANESANQEITGLLDSKKKESHTKLVFKDFIKQCIIKLEKIKTVNLCKNSIKVEKEKEKNNNFVNLFSSGLNTISYPSILGYVLSFTNFSGKNTSINSKKTNNNSEVEEVRNTSNFSTFTTPSIKSNFLGTNFFIVDDSTGNIILTNLNPINFFSVVLETSSNSLSSSSSKAALLDTHPQQNSVFVFHSEVTSSTKVISYKIENDLNGKFNGVKTVLENEFSSFKTVDVKFSKNGKLLLTLYNSGKSLKAIDLFSGKTKHNINFYFDNFKEIRCAENYFIIFSDSTLLVFNQLTFEYEVYKNFSGRIIVSTENLLFFFKRMWSLMN